MKNNILSFPTWPLYPYRNKERENSCGNAIYQSNKNISRRHIPMAICCYGRIDIIGGFINCNNCNNQCDKADKKGSKVYFHGKCFHVYPLEIRMLSGL